MSVHFNLVPAPREAPVGKPKYYALKILKKSEVISGELPAAISVGAAAVSMKPTRTR